MWGKLRKCWVLPNFSAKPLDSQLNMASPRGQGRRGKSHPESRAFLKPPDDPKDAHGLLPDSPPHRSAHAFQGDLRLVPVLLGTHA